MAIYSKNEEKESMMPYGKGTYGSQRGRPPKNQRMKKADAMKLAKDPDMRKLAMKKMKAMKKGS